jgi:hypothetical protein
MDQGKRVNDQANFDFGHLWQVERVAGRDSESSYKTIANV